MVGGCPSVLGCSRTVLKFLGNSSRGLRIFWYIVLLYCISRIVLISQAERLPRFLCVIMSKLLGSVSSHDLLLCISIFPRDAAFRDDLADLLFTTLTSIASRSDFSVAYYISDI